MVYAAVTWIFAVGVVLSLIVGYGVGANDVANTFGPSVGAKALTMRQALLVAAVFEMAGAVLMGSGVTETIRSGITNISYFQDSPDVLAYGMLCALGATGAWMLLATYWELPVSSTQAIVASIAGMAVVAEGWGAVVWSASKDEFPYVKGMSAIALSWLFAPILAGGFSFLLFWVVRGVVLRRPNAYQRSLFLLPLFTLVTCFVVTWFVIAKGGLQYGWEKTPDTKKAWISATVAGGATLLSIVLGVPFIRRSVERDMSADEQRAAAGMPPTPAKSIDITKGASGSEQSDEEAGAVPAAASDSDPEAQAAEEMAAPKGAVATPMRLQTLRQSRLWKAATHGLNYDIHKVAETDARIREIHASAEVFDRKAEYSFKYLQIFTACANIFAHGSNEVANSVGPLAAIFQIWQDTSVSSKPEVPTWLLAIGGFAMCIGLATFGYKVMCSMGVKMARLSNSRGFCVELCVAAVVILASRFGLPMSSTPATVGAIAGVGLWEGRAGFNARLFFKFAAGWVMTIVAAVLLSMAFMAQGLYAPNKTCADQRATVGAYLNTTSAAIAAVLPPEQAQSILGLAGAQGFPIVDLIPPADTQCQALALLNGTSAAVCATL